MQELYPTPHYPAQRWRFQIVPSDQHSRIAGRYMFGPRLAGLAMSLFVAALLLDLP
jgi:hypothetical protein